MSSPTSKSLTPTQGAWSIGAEYGSYKTEIVSEGRAIATVWTSINEINGDSKACAVRWDEGLCNLALLASAKLMYEALCKIADMQDGEQAWYARDLANAALDRCQANDTRRT